MAERNYEEDKALLYRALYESLEERFEKTVKESSMDASYPRSFRIKMSWLLGVDIEKPTRSIKALKAAVIIAAICAVLLTGCAIVKFFGPFVETYFSDYAWVVNKNDDVGKKEFEEVYTITYIPSGYAYVREHEGPNMYTHIWKNPDGKAIKFTQSATLSYFYANIESGYSSLMFCNQTEIYFKQGKSTFSYIWQDEKYAFEIISEEELSQNDVKLMFDSVKTR